MESKRLSLLAAAALLLVSAPLCADIPTPEEMELQYALTMGAGFPVGDTRDSSTFIVGVSWYGSAGEFVQRNAAIGLSVDWMNLSRVSDGKEADIFPILLNWRQYSRVSNRRVFTNLGIGVTVSSDDLPEIEIDEGANFGWTVGAGVDITDRLFGQIRFVAGTSPGDDGIITTEIGFRF